MALWTFNRPLAHSLITPLCVSFIALATVVACHEGGSTPKRIDSVGGSEGGDADVDLGDSAGDSAGESAGDSAGESAGNRAGETTVEFSLECSLGDIVGPMLIEGTSEQADSTESQERVDSEETVDGSAQISNHQVVGVYGHDRLFLSDHIVTKEERSLAQRREAIAQDLWGLSSHLAVIYGDLSPTEGRRIEPMGNGFWLVELKELPRLYSRGLSLLTWRDKIDNSLRALIPTLEAPNHVSHSSSNQLITARLTLWAENTTRLKELLKSSDFTPFNEKSSTSLNSEFADRSLKFSLDHQHQSRGAEAAQHIVTLRYTTPPRSLPASHWRRLTEHPHVLHMSLPEIKPKILNEPSRDLMAMDEVTQPQFRPGQRAPLFKGWSGEGVRVAIMDSGIAIHPDFYMYDESSGEMMFDRIRGALPPSEQDSHGTTVAGILAGNGYASIDHLSPLGLPNEPFQWRGQAPMVREIQSYLMFGTGDASDDPPWEQMFETQQAHLANHSHTFGNGFYTNETQGYDAFISGTMISDEELDAGGLAQGQEFSTPPRPVFLSAGNNGLYPQESIFMRLHGYYGLLVNLKNGILVGSVESNDAQPSDFSSLGPTLDGRLKPDIMAPGSSDERPLSGFDLELGEVRVHAKRGSGLPDLVWKWGRPHPTLSPWKGEGAFAPNEVTLLDGVILGKTFGSYATRIFWERVEDEKAISAADYESISYEYRVTLPDDALYDLPKEIGREALQTKHSAPSVWMLRWGDDVGRGYDETRFLRHTETSQEGTWTRVKYRFDEGWEGEISRLRITPAIYWGGVYTTSMWGGYDFVSGTSMASPAAAGVGAAVLEQLVDQHGFDLENRPPSPALIRGLMIQSARDLTRMTPPPRASNSPDTGFPPLYGPGPDFSTGFGLLDAHSMSRLIEESSQDSRWLEGVIAPGEEKRIKLRVSSMGPLKVTLTWDDAPGSIMTPSWQSKLIHDLDLAVLSPVGEAHGPWVLSPPPLKLDGFEGGEDELSVTDIQPARRCIVEDLETLWSGIDTSTTLPESVDDLIYAPRGNARCVDDLNLIEQVEIHAPIEGEYEVVIRGPKEGGGPQAFVILWSQRCPLVE